MNVDLNVCQTCLSRDRLLYPLKNFELCLSDMNIPINIYEYNAGVCWECKAVLMKFAKFKLQVIEAQKLITSNTEKNTLSTLQRTTKCSYDCIYNYETNIDSNTDIKIKSIKEEILENSDNINRNIESEDKKDYNELKYKDNDNCDKINYTNIHLLSTNKSKINLSKDLDNKNKKCHTKSKHKSTKLLSIDSKKIRDKIETITFTEDEMIKNREHKRNQPNYKKIPYKCDYCVLGFTRKETYILHNKKKHDESIGPHACDVCSVRFATTNSLVSHRQRHYTLYKCVLCKYEATLLKAAVNHCVIKHDKDEQGLIHCAQCSVTVETADDLAAHMNTNHMLKCNQCGEKFKGKHTLRTHYIRIHSSNRAFTCDVCTKTFKTKSRLESHITSHNNTLAKKLAYCSICKVQYKNIYVYRNHLKNSANHSERLYHCEDCNKRFASKVYWQKHCDFYHLQKSAFKCDLCNKLFMSDWRLKNHKQKHHGLSRSRDHICNICGKKFYTLSTLRGHQLTHSEERTYMCEDCGDTFKQRPALYTHTKLVHRGVKRIKQN
ncbi:zinc finger protein 808-like [Vanessa atalanta]|uniref:zinc finger protein 808-like n=1 Tax=Vanessa atalanta TaxID=42275 RepID=UPI001FCD2A8D|nr:zinc finger protein 808-like [Vanessa atalanta]